MLTALDHAIEKYYTTYKLCLRDWVQSPEIGEEHFAKERARVRGLIKLHRRLQFGTVQARADYRRFIVDYRREHPSDCQWRQKLWRFASAARRRNNPELRASGRAVPALSQQPAIAA